MPKTIIWIIATIFVIVSLVAMYSWMKEHTLKILSDSLYVEADPKKYLAILNSKRVKYLFSKKNIEFMRLNVYLICNDYEKMGESFQKLSDVFLKRDEKLNYEYLKLVYYSKLKNKEQANIAWLTIDRMGSPKNSEKEEALIKESEIIYKVNFEPDSELTNDLIESLKTQDKKQQAITYFRLAKVSYSLGNPKEAIAYLKKIDSNNTDSSLTSIIEDCKKSPKLLEKY